MPIIFVGLIFFPRHFLSPALLILLTMILSPLLKSIFAIPYTLELVQRLGKQGFSFPSGHMQSACVFYGWFLLANINHFIHFGLLFIITGIGFGLIYSGYHDIYDVSGAIFFAFVTISLYKFFLSCMKKKMLNISDDLAGSFFVLGLSLILIIILASFYEIPAHSIMALYSILGMVVGLYITKNFEKFNTRLIYLILVVIGLSVLSYLFSKIKFEILFLKQIKWIFIALTFPFLATIAKKLNSRNHEANS